MKTMMRITSAISVVLLLSGAAFAGSMMDQKTKTATEMNTGMMEKDTAMDAKAGTSEEAGMTKDEKMMEESRPMATEPMEKKSMIEEKAMDTKEEMK